MRILVLIAVAVVSCEAQSYCMLKAEPTFKKNFEAIPSARDPKFENVPEYLMLLNVSKSCRRAQSNAISAEFFRPQLTKNPFKKDNKTSKYQRIMII